MIKTRILLIGVLSVFMILTGCRGKQGTAEFNPNPQSKTSLGTTVSANQSVIKAPDFTLAKLNGDLFSLNEFSGKVILLNFWGTWCGPCRMEIPDLNILQTKYQKDGLEIVGITLTSGSPSDIQNFVDNWEMNYTILTDIKNVETQHVVNWYGRATGRPITGIPTTFIINREGKIVKAYVGPRSEEIFYNDLKRYL